MPPPASGIAEALDGQYAIEREIGRGGMGVVYLARDLKLDRSVAIKTLPPHLAADPVVRERFLREARTAGALSHPNIVPVYRADDLAGHVFFVMEYVNGESLAARIRSQGTLGARQCVALVRDVAAALAHAHSRGVVHRDVKAENILIERETGRAVVTDFGIARLAESAPLTATGQMLGTVYYLSPEQIAGDPVDARTDIYAIGVVGYLALSGQFPFDGPLASAVLVAHVNKAVPRLASTVPGIAPGLAAVMERCLAKRPEDRFASCRELIEALARVEPELDASIETAAPPRAALVSDTEAHAILDRAVELDAMTAARERPWVARRDRDVARDLERTSGYRVDAVREAALEVGVAKGHVDRALAEHGLLPAPVVPRSKSATAPDPAHTAQDSPRPVVQEHANADSIVDGVTVKLRYSAEIDGEMPERDFDVLVDMLRRESGSIGQLSIVGRSLMWESDPAGSRDLRASVLARNGTTTISVFESLEAQLPRPLLTSPAFAGWTAIGALCCVALGPEVILPAIPLYGIGVVALFARARSRLGSFGALSRERATAVHALTERLATGARDRIASARRRPDSLAGGSPRPAADMVGAAVAGSADAFDQRLGGAAGARVRGAVDRATGGAGPEDRSILARLAGRPLQAECEIVLDGEMRPTDFDVIVDLIRRRLRERGVLAANPLSIAWSAPHGSAHQVEISVLPRFGKTAIRTTESLARIAHTLTGWAGVTLGVTTLFSVCAAVELQIIGPSGPLQPPGVVGFSLVGWSSVALATFAVSRWVFRRRHDRRQTFLQELTEEIASLAQRSIQSYPAAGDPSKPPRTYVLDDGSGPRTRDP
ncbi:MAG TPA: serine/threonine-protein kinase [Gemmatimonadaceae bacterium]|nr:serine/threonine-protein kinase [Gemmatimonadaceae bacterium]